MCIRVAAEDGLYVTSDYVVTHNSMCAVNETALRALRTPGTRTASIAPTYAQTKIGFRWLTRVFRPVFRDKPNLSELRIEWMNGSTTQCLSTDNYDAIRGFAFDFLVGDEFGSWQREAWEAAIRPTLADTQGGALLVGTPKGRNLFYELWLRGQDRQQWPDYASWQFPTRSNPFIDPSEVHEARHSLPLDVFEQEWEAKFLEDHAGVFRHVAQAERGELRGPEVGGVYVIGWDPAKHADASVVTVFDVRHRHVVAWDRWLSLDYTVQLARVAALSRRYNGAAILMDSTGVGDPLLEALGQKDVAVEGYQFTNTSKQQLVEHLAVQLQQGSFTFPALPVLRAELDAFQYELTRAGNVRYSAPDGAHDDCVISLALAVWAARTAGGELWAVGLADEPRRERFAAF